MVYTRKNTLTIINSYLPTKRLFFVDIKKRVINQVHNMNSAIEATVPMHATISYFDRSCQLLLLEYLVSY